MYANSIKILKFNSCWIFDVSLLLFWKVNTYRIHSVERKINEVSDLTQMIPKREGKIFNPSN